MDRTAVPRHTESHRPGSGRWLSCFPPLACLLAALQFGCAAKPPPVPPPATAPDLFEDATERLGVRFVHDCGDPSDYSMVRVMGSGCAIFDADGDGLPDLLLLQNAGDGSRSANKLFRQNAEGRFDDVSDGSGLDFAGFNMGVAVGDYDGDGRPDVFVTRHRGAKLFRNLGGCKFADATAECGIENPHWGTSASFLDFDRDGRPDIVVGNYLAHDPKQQCSDPAGKRDFCGPAHFPNSGAPALLFRNLGPNGTGPVRFENVTQRSGLGAAPSAALGLYCADLTGDGWPDVFVANDGKPNHLWVNQRDGTFREEAVLRGLALTGDGKTAANMGIAVGDADGDGLTDLFVTHLTTEMNTLWRQGPPGRFADRTLAAGAVATRWRGTGFGTAMADLDLDARADLVLVNGRVHRGPDTVPELPEFWRQYGERNQILRNTGGAFVDVSEANPSFCGAANVARGLAVGDLNGDGRPDLLVNSIGTAAKVYLNRGGDHRWLAVRPCLANGHLAHGAEVRVVAGGRAQFRVLQPTESYLSSSNPELLFGLGDAERYDEIQVVWPDGGRQVLPGGPSNRRVELKRTPAP